MKILSVFVVLAVLVIFPVFIFYLFIRAVRDPGTRWWGIVTLLAILTCYCTTMVGIAGLLVGSNATGSAALERHYCLQFCEALTQTETLPEAIARMDAAAATDEYQIHEPDKNLRFRYVWLLGGCFLFAGANLMMFGPGRREKRHPADCVMMILAALVVFLTGVWQIAWGNGYAAEAGLYQHTLAWISARWHEDIPPDELPISNARIAAWLSGEPMASTEKNLKVKRIHELFGRISSLYAEPEQKSRLLPQLPEPDETEKPEDEAAPADAPADAGTVSKTGPGVAIIGGADGPTAVFIRSELLKQNSIPAESAKETESSTETSADSKTENAVSDL